MARKRGSGKYKGFWFRDGRGWYVTEGKSSVPLLDEKGNHIKDATDVEGAKAAHARYVLRVGTRSKHSLSVEEACSLYLDHAEKGSAKTYEMRKALLFDFCTGYPARCQGKAERLAKDQAHPGYGNKETCDLTLLDIERWLDAHPAWVSRRVPLQAIRRVLLYCVKMKVLDSNPLAGLKVPEVGCRETYMTPEVEQAIYGLCKAKYKNGREKAPALAQFVEVCILTGCRPDIEFNSLEARHVEETADGQQWHFPLAEAKGRKKDRMVYVPDGIAVVVRQLAAKYPTGPLFRDERGKPWSLAKLDAAFRRLRVSLQAKGVAFVEPLIPYTCRHTYAKRRLGGFWGPPVTIEILAGLMGNSVKVCWQHYARWSSQYVKPFWDAINPRKPNAGRGVT